MVKFILVVFLLFHRNKDGHGHLTEIDFYCFTGLKMVMVI